MQEQINEVLRLQRRILWFGLTVSALFGTAIFINFYRDEARTRQSASMIRMQEFAVMLRTDHADIESLVVRNTRLMLRIDARFDSLTIIETKGTH